MKVSWYGASPGMPDLPPSASVTLAPTPAACAALRRCGIVDHAGGGALGVVAHQRAQHARGVGIAAGARIVLGVGDHDRLVRGLRQLHRMQHAFVGREDAAVEIVLVADDDVHDGIGRGVGMRLGHAVGEHARSAIREIGGRKPRRKRQRRHRVVLQRRELLVDALGRLVVGALPADRNQERQLPERLGEFLPGAEQQRQMFGGRRGRCRPCRHADRCGRRSVRPHAPPFRASRWRADRG